MWFGGEPTFSSARSRSTFRRTKEVIVTENGNRKGDADPMALKQGDLGLLKSDVETRPRRGATWVRTWPATTSAGSTNREHGWHASICGRRGWVCTIFARASRARSEASPSSVRQRRKRVTISQADQPFHGPIHHLGYVVEDIEATVEQLVRTLKAGPFLRRPERSSRGRASPCQRLMRAGLTSAVRAATADLGGQGNSPGRRRRRAS
jgi:hypothetical protein